MLLRRLRVPAVSAGALAMDHLCSALGAQRCVGLVQRCELPLADLEEFLLRNGTCRRVAVADPTVRLRAQRSRRIAAEGLFPYPRPLVVAESAVRCTSGAAEYGVGKGRPLQRLRRASRHAPVGPPVERDPRVPGVARLYVPRCAARAQRSSTRASTGAARTRPRAARTAACAAEGAALCAAAEAG